MRALLAASLLVVLWSASACSAGYQGRTEALRGALDAGRVDTAIGLVNGELGVERAEAQPAKADPDTPLLLLERAALLQAVGRHEEAARDFAAADRSLEVLDFTQDDAGAVGKYLFSDDASIYKAPPHEKLMVNTLAMVSHLTIGDLESARVEARRFNVLQQFFQDAAPEELSLFGLSSYLAGVTFEASGDPEEALRYYIEARGRGAGGQAQIALLGRRTGFVHDAVQEATQAAPEASPLGPGEGELVLVVQSGRAPYKVAERLPIGAFFVEGRDVRGRMTPAQRAEADKAVVEGLLKWINFPALKGASRRPAEVRVSLPGGREVAPEVDLDVGLATIRAWEQDQGLLMLAAFTRMLARALAGELTEAVGEGADLDRALFPGASWLLGQAVEGGLAAADTPDTRSWTMMPGQIEIYRVRLPAGTHEVGASGRTPAQRVQIQAGKITVASLRILR